MDSVGIPNVGIYLWCTLRNTQKELIFLASMKEILQIKKMFKEREITIWYTVY